jgi:hypothetical protein
MKAIVDRIEDNLAVLFMEPDEKIQFTIPSEALPGIKEGDIVDVIVTKDENATQDARAMSNTLIQKIKTQKSG